MKRRNFFEKHPILETIWVLGTAPLIIFVGIDWFLDILPTSATIIFSIVGIVSAVLIARRWERQDEEDSGMGPPLP